MTIFAAGAAVVEPALDVVEDDVVLVVAAPLPAESVDSSAGVAHAATKRCAERAVNALSRIENS